MWSLADLAVNWPERVEDLKVTHSIRVQWTAQVIFLSFWDKKSEKFMNFKLVFWYLNFAKNVGEKCAIFLEFLPQL